MSALSSAADAGNARAADAAQARLTGALVTLALEAPGETVELRLAYRLTSWNEPVEIPSVGG